MDFQKKNKGNYDRVMSRVYHRSRSSLKSSSNVTRHDVPSSVRVGAKPSVSAVSSGVFSELPTVLNDYVPDLAGDKVVKKVLVRPRKTLKSLDPSKVKGLSRPPRVRGTVQDRTIRAPSSVPTVLTTNGEEWSESHVRQCYSSRSHTRLKELKDEIKAFRETDKLMKIRSHLYKSCGVVLDDVGNVAQDKAVQADPEPDKENTHLRRQEWLKAIDREDLLLEENKKKAKHNFVCSAHFDDSAIITTISRRLKSDAAPTKLLPHTSSNYIEIDVPDLIIPTKNISTQTLPQTSKNKLSHLGKPTKKKKMTTSTDSHNQNQPQTDTQDSE